MRTQAIVIKKIPIQENDELIVCYTEDKGKKTYRAKSSVLHSSKQRSHLDILNHIDFSLVEGNGQPIITSASSLSSFRNIKNNIKAVAVAYFILECFDKLVYDAQADPAMWRFLHTNLYDINTSATDDAVNWTPRQNQIQQELMSVMGYGHDTLLHELHPTSFSSLQLIRKVLS